MHPFQATKTVLNIKDTVKSMQGNLSTLVPEVGKLLNRLKCELFEPIIALATNAGSSDTQTTIPDPGETEDEDELDPQPSTSCANRKRRHDGDVDALEYRLDVKIFDLDAKEDTETDESSSSSAIETISLGNSYKQPESISRNRFPSTINSPSPKSNSSFDISSLSSNDSRRLLFPSPPKKPANISSPASSEKRYKKRKRKKSLRIRVLLKNLKFLNFSSDDSPHKQ